MADAKRPTLIVIAGPNGSGKSTVIEQLLRSEWGEGVTYINPDDVAMRLFWGMDREANIKALEYCARWREELLSQKKDIAFETVFSGPDKLDYIRRARQEGYFVRLFFVSLDTPEHNAARVAKRVMQGGHSVPIEKIISRYFKSINNCKTASAIVDRMYVYDNSIEDRTARLLFRTMAGRFIKEYPQSDMPVWAASVRRSFLLQAASRNVKDWVLPSDTLSELVEKGTCLFDGTIYRKNGTGEPVGVFLQLSLHGTGIFASEPGNPRRTMPLDDYVRAGVDLNIRPGDDSDSLNQTTGISTSAFLKIK